MQQILIDRFTMPVTARPEFFERMKINRDLIHSLPGFIKDEVFERCEGDTFYIVTTAFWEDTGAIENAKSAVIGQYKREGLDMQEMLRRLSITIDRGQFTKLEQ